MKREYPVLCIMGAACRPDELGGPRTTDRAWVCNHCTDRLADGFRKIATMWPDLTDALTAGAVGGGERGRQRNGAIPHTLPYDERASFARRFTSAHVWFSVRTLYECRGTIRLPEPIDIPTLARWLADWHTPTLVTRPGFYTTSTIVEGTSVAVGRIRAVIDGASPIRRRPTGVPCDTAGCPGTYVATVGAGITTDLLCDVDPGHTIPPATWQRHSWIRTHRPIDLTRLAEEIKP